MLMYDKSMKTEYGLTMREWQDIWAVAKTILLWCQDPFTGIHSATKLAEAVADSLEKWEWLDIETHPIWDICADICTELDDETYAGEIDLDSRDF